MPFSALSDGIAWNSLASTVSQAVSLLRILVVATAIGPEGMGIFAIAASLQVAISAAGEFGIRWIYIASPRFSDIPDAKFLGSSWLSELFIKWLLVVASVPVGFLASLPFADPQLSELIIGICASSAVLSLANPAFLIREKSGHFKHLAVADIVAQFSGLIVAAWLAAVTQSPWSLVGGAFAQSVTYVVMSYLAHPLPPVDFDKAVVHRILNEGRHFTVLATMTFITYNLDKLLVGFIVSPAATGLFLIAQRLSEVPAAVFGQAVGRTLLPHYVHTLRIDGKRALDNEVRRFLRTVAVLTLAALALTASGIYFDFHHLLGSEWWAMAPLVPALIVGVGARMGCTVVAQALVVKGLVYIDRRLKVQETMVYLAVLPMLVWVWGSHGAIIGFVLMYLAALVRRIHALSAIPIDQRGLHKTKLDLVRRLTSKKDGVPGP